ncbi:DNA primase [Zooshikella sp. RANM57]
MSGLIPQTFIDDLLARTDIVDVIGGRVQLKKTGKNLAACCPFHQEKTPSFTVSPDKQFYYCFGCGAAGNALRFIMEFDQLDFPQAVEQLAQSLGLDVPREAQQYQRQAHRFEALFEITKQSATYFQQQLFKPSGQSAQHYIQQRGLSAAVLKQYAIGYAPAGWQNLLEHIGQSPENTQHLLTTGLVIENPEKQSIYDRFRHRLIFPIRDIRGRFIGFGGRVLNPNDKPKYLNSPETPIFQKRQELYGLFEARQQQRQLDFLLVVEGYMDVVALAQNGIPNVVATLGTAVSQEHVTRLFKTVKEVFYCFDGDEAGRKAAWRALETTLPFMQDGYQAKFLFLPEGEDPDSLVRKEGQKAFLTRLKRNSQSIADYFFQTLCEQVDIQHMDGKARLAALAKPFIEQLPQGVFYQLMLGHLAELTGLSEQALSELSQVPAQPTSKTSAESATKPTAQYLEKKITRHSAKNFVSASKLSVSLTPAQVAVYLLSKYPEFAEQVEHSDRLANDQSEHTRLLAVMLKLLKDNPQASVGHLIGELYNTPLGNIYAAVLNRPPPQTGQASKEVFLEALTRLQQQLNLEDTYQELSQFKNLKSMDASKKEAFMRAFEQLRQSKR